MPRIRRDILWIVTTQWRAQSTGYSGDSNARTPTLDALEKTSANYAAAVTPHPFGPFARAAMLTGVPSPENGLRHYFDPLPVGSRTIAPDQNDRGYQTAWFGKWHLAQRAADVPLVGEAHARMIVPVEARGGFALWEGFESGFLLNDPWLHGTRLATPQRFVGYQSDVLCDRAAEWIASERARRSAAPRFCVVSLEAPHPPYDAPAAGVLPAAHHQLELSANVPRGGDAEARARRELAGYYAHLKATDGAIGRLVSSVAEDVVVVFTSVHGDMHGAHGFFRKGWPYEESVRVPLLIRCAAAGEDGESRVDPQASVSLLDLPAMTRAWADGVAWSSSRDHARISMPGVVDLPDQCDRAWYGVRTPDWKAVWTADHSPWLMFNLREDAGETCNLVSRSEAAPVLRSMRERWLRSPP